MKRKNILIVVLDGCRADRIGVYGYRKRDTTPVIDSLARSGFVCKNNYSTSFCTMPSIVSVLTGQYPAVHRATAMWGYADARFPFLTELLRKSGYFTFGVSNSIKAMSPELGFVRGYDKYYRVGKESNWFKESKEEQRGVKKPEASVQLKRGLIRILERLSKSTSDKLVKTAQLSWYSENDMGGARAIDGFFQGVDSCPSDTPFFSYVNLPDTHSPYMTVKQFSEKFGKLNITENLLMLLLQPNEFEEEGRELNKEEFEMLQTYYDTCVSYSDHLFGKIVNGLKDRDIFESTTIIIIGDHGGNTWEKKRLYGASCFTYQEEIRVPLILLNGGSVGETNLLTSLIDVFPTILDIASIPNSERPSHSGRNVLSLNAGHPYVLVDYPAYPRWLKIRIKKYLRALINYGFVNRTIITSSGHKFIWLNSGEHERFDLNIDPHEHNNLYSGSPIDFSFIKLLQDAYAELLGDCGRQLEIYPHNDIGDDFEFLPPLEIVNPEWNKQKIINF
jgi:arylsulfatase A-like enzyme